MDGCELTDPKSVERIAKLLGTSTAKLAAGLTKKTISAQGDSVTTILSPGQAVEAKDAFAKALYGNLFVYIVQKIDNVIKPQQTTTDKYIGVLDIFGFENFENNSFEQLCINLANENLQQFFVRHIFKLEQEMYTNEGVDWKHIKFVDNQSILDMIAVKPMSILGLIDEEAKFPKGTDLTMLEKIVSAHEEKKEFFRPKFKGVSAFGVYHFAGAVFYNVADFLEKDRDSFSADLKNLAETSQSQFVRALFPIETTTAHGTGKKKDTLALKFRQSLDLLMAELGQCQPYFVRCIKPNDLKRPDVFDRPLCCRQLRYSGMMETAKIRQAGFPIRYTFEQFVERFRMLARGVPPAHRVDCKAATAKICDSVFGGVGEFRLGYNKIFLKTPEDIMLDNLRTKCMARVVLVLQKNVRGWLCRRRYQKLRSAAILVQSRWRGKGPRQRYLIRRQGYLRLQARIRSRLLQHKFSIIRTRVLALQAYCKGYAIRKEVRRKVQEKKSKMQELMEIRRQEEARLKKAGNKRWREVAEENWRKSLAELNITIAEEPRPQEQQAFDENDEEEQTKMIENAFQFLDGSQSPDASVLKELGIGRGNYRKDDYIGLDDMEAETEDLSEYNFSKFAKMYFRGNATYHHSFKPLRQPLLDTTGDEFAAAAKALWITLLRFMDDMGEPRFNIETDKTIPVMMQISRTLSRNFTKSTAYRDAVGAEQERERRRKLISMTLKRSNNISADIRAAMEADAEGSYAIWLETRTSNLEKLHFIIGHGILKPELRDEIFAQICKQLTHNHKQTSLYRGWVLLSLCVGCFLPTDLMLKTLKAFVKSGPPPYYKFMMNRIYRTNLNGPRTQPPGWVELQAVKKRENIAIPVTLSDGAARTLMVDSATTSREMVELITRSLGVQQTYGFGILISLYDKVSSLGCGREHVLDAVSQCEQYAREQGQPERSASWRMFLRKEMFAPWHDSAADPVATKLICRQVLHGVHEGEYRCEKESDLAQVMAMQYYIEHGLLDKRKLTSDLSTLLPQHIFRSLDNDKLMRWPKLVEDSYAKHLTNRMKQEEVQGKIVDFAKFKWPLMFSKIYEVIDLSGSLPKERIVVAINWTGVFMVDNSEHVLMELPFMSIQSVSIKENKPVLIMTTIEGAVLDLQGNDVNELHTVLDDILTQLKKLSKFVVVIQDYKPPAGSSYMELQKGDLITLSEHQTGESLEFNTWGEGTNDRTGASGPFPTDSVTVVRTMVRPPAAVVALLKEGPAAAPRGYGIGTIKRLKLHTLEHYAAEHFRVAARRSTISRGTSMVSVKENQLEELWRHSREPIKHPLLKRLHGSNELVAYACNAFISILKYMGDQPTKRARLSTEYTDKIFEHAIKHEALRDEIYCQIMKQLTGNRNKIGEDRGWELMWLATGLFSCSADLERELLKFLNSRRTSDIANDCEQRYQRTRASGSRKHPPHQVEVEAIQHKRKQIYHKVYFPDDSDAAFEVDSNTRARNLIDTIAKKLKLRSCEGFTLFIKVWNKVLTIPDNDYFFDFVRLITDWVKRNLPNNGDSATQYSYNLLFMRKLWTISPIGKDPIADQMFHFPQELPKYLRGYHLVKKDDAVNIAAVLYIEKFGNSKVEITKVETLPLLMPQNVLKTHKPKELLKSVASALNGYKGLVKTDAQFEFLRLVSQFPTFGSAFFDVKQSSDLNLPEFVTVAINRKGVQIIHPDSKVLLQTYEYPYINNWRTGSTFFNLQLGAGNYRLLFETQLGYKMDDLISSYAALLATATRRKSVKGAAPRPPIAE